MGRPVLRRRSTAVLLAATAAVASAVPAADVLGTPPPRGVVWLLWALSVVLAGALCAVVAAYARQLRSERDLSRATLRALHDGLFVLRDDRIVDVNDRFCSLVGMPRERLLGATYPLPFWPPELHERLERAKDGFFAAGRSYAEEWHFVRASGERFPVQVTADVARIGDGPQLAVVAVRDLTAERAFADAVVQERDALHAVLGAMRDAYFVSRGNVIIDVNDECLRLTGFRREELVGSPSPYPFLRGSDEADHEALRRQVALGHGADFELECVRRDGTPFVASMASRPAHDAGGRVVGFVTTFRDVTADRRRESDLAYKAEHDPLTGLRNRAGFESLLDDLLEDAHADGRSMTLALLDVDHFKRINDEHGHPAGDRALVAIAARLRRQCRGEDVIARIGGEELAWLLLDASPEDAERAVERARRALSSTPLGEVGQVTLSAGLCSAGGARTRDELYAAADAALYEAKRTGRDRIVVAARSQATAA